jgi:two-component system NtrC family sensor kinase
VTEHGKMFAETSIALDAAFIAHQLKNPLTVIIGRAEMLLSSDRDPLEKQSINDIYLAAIRATSILNNILLFVKGKSLGTFCPVRINDIVKDTILLFDRQLKEENITLEMRLEDEVQFISGNGYLLQQVFFNLVMNASQALESWQGKRTLTITTAARADTVELIIADTGPGVSPDHARNIFSPFFTTKGTGSGFGLSFARSVVEGHGGSIDLVPLDEGCCFLISLPVCKVPGAEVDAGEQG